MGELGDQVRAIILVDSSDDEQLENFFIFITKYNDRMPMNQGLRERFTSHFQFGWRNNRLNFLLAEEDRAMFSQLETSLQVRILTDFIFRDFLFRFRRFFQFRVSDMYQSTGNKYI